MLGMYYVEGDLFDRPPTFGTTFICHVCNEVGAWGSGFVVPLGQRYPQAREEYLRWADQTTGVVQSPPFEMGEVQFVKVEPHVIVANMVAQQLGGDRPLFYNDLSSCMDDVRYVVGQYANPKIICPMFGSGLAGGDWNFVEKLIEDCWVRHGMEVTIYYFKRFLPKNWSPPKKMFYN